jgi:hypothetical protein
VAEEEVPFELLMVSDVFEVLINQTVMNLAVLLL